MANVPSMDEMQAALHDGDPQRVQALIDAGGNVRYRREAGYDALIDAVHGRDVGRDPRLIELLAILGAEGVNLSGVSDFAESGLRVLSHLGRFDAVRLLLQMGAEKWQLKWTPLLEAVAIGSLDDVRAALDAGASLEDRDWWERTAWLTALTAGDIAKATLLRERGADVTTRGRCGCPSLFYAAQSRRADVVQWLIAAGADVDEKDDFGSTALIHAVEFDDLGCVETLIAAGADVNINCNGSVLSRATSRDVAMRLIEAGTDPAEADARIVLRLPTVEHALNEISADEFRRTWLPTFGNDNPQRMVVPFWEAMIRTGGGAYSAREHFRQMLDAVRGPVWCASRFGQSWTQLGDGRSIQVGGEHEDFYDPDFRIYNDVFVHAPDGTTAIYGYPKDVFPPTDFHTATLLGDAIYLIGSLGYHGERRHGTTPVYRLCTRTLRIDRIDVTGDAPGWIHRQRAAALNDREIQITGGEIVEKGAVQETFTANERTFVLDVKERRWRRMGRA